MIVFVTGGTGFVGSYVLRELHARGHAVRALVRNPRKAAPLTDVIDTVVSGNLEDHAALSEGMAGADAVIHIAGLLFETRRGQFDRVNVQGTRNVLEAAASGVKRFVLISSIAAAGPSDPDRPMREGDPPRPVSEYGQSKLAAEDVAWHYRDRLGVTVVRPPIVYGPGDTATLTLFKIAKLGIAASAVDPRSRVSLVFVEDLARGIVDTVEKDAAAGETFYFSDPEYPSVREFIGAIGASLGKSPRILRLPALLVRGAAKLSDGITRVTGKASEFNSDKVREMLAAHWMCSADHARQTLGWEVQVPYRDGLARAARWYREEGWL